MTIPTHKPAFARLKEFKLEIAVIAVGLAVGFCSTPAPAQTLDPYARDLYQRDSYPFQTPEQIGRQADVKREVRRREDRDDRIRYQEREDARFDRQLERDLEAIRNGR